jgi:hypothetical protein
MSRLILKIFSIRKLMQSADVNTLDGDNQLHLIFYLMKKKERERKNIYFLLLIYEVL